MNNFELLSPLAIMSPMCLVGIKTTAPATRKQDPWISVFDRNKCQRERKLRVYGNPRHHVLNRKKCKKQGANKKKRKIEHRFFRCLICKDSWGQCREARTFAAQSTRHWRLCARRRIFVLAKGEKVVSVEELTCAQTRLPFLIHTVSSHAIRYTLDSFYYNLHAVTHDTQNPEALTLTRWPSFRAHSASKSRRPPTSCSQSR